MKTSINIDMIGIAIVILNIVTTEKRGANKILLFIIQEKPYLACTLLLNGKI